MKLWNSLKLLLLNLTQRRLKNPKILAMISEKRKDPLMKFGQQDPVLPEALGYSEDLIETSIIRGLLRLLDYAHTVMVIYNDISRTAETKSDKQSKMSPRVSQRKILM